MGNINTVLKDILAPGRNKFLQLRPETGIHLVNMIPQSL